MRNFSWLALLAREELNLSGFRRRGLANGVSLSFSENATEKREKKEKRQAKKKTEETGKKTRKRKRKKQKKTEESKRTEVTPFRRPLLRNPELGTNKFL